VAQNWVEVEQFFTKANIQFERKDWVYLKALETHPDSGGTPEAFRQVHSAYQFLLGVSC
jgi:hypothetical protein